jgi:hypothetical protein
MTAVLGHDTGTMLVIRAGYLPPHVNYESCYLFLFSDSDNVVMLCMVIILPWSRITSNVWCANIILDLI